MATGLLGAISMATILRMCKQAVKIVALRVPTRQVVLILRGQTSTRAPAG